MRVVIVDGDLSYPATSGKRLRTLNLMLRPARRHCVTYIGRCDDARSPDARRAAAFLRDHGVEPLLVTDPLPAKSGPGLYARLAANLFSPLPYSAATHRGAALRRAVHDHAARHPVDLWQVEWVSYLRLLPDGVPRAPRVLVAHNVETVLWQRYHDTARGPARRWFLGRQWRRFERFERENFATASRVVAVSEEDARLIRDRFGMPRVDVVENGIDRAYFQAVAGPRKPATVLFLGALDWRPNLDAVGLLLDRIFPEVRARVPAARLCVVGRHAPAGLARRIAREPQVELRADVADVRPYLAESGVLAVPLRIAGGSRLKILEALACGLPVVSTRVGAEGLRLSPGRDYHLAEDGEMARALAEVLLNPGPAQAMAGRARALVLQEYDWDVLAAKLERVWEECVRRAAPEPRPTAGRC
jgi:glycosyltransferase involved in cell wall biosynthesis